MAPAAQVAEVVVDRALAELRDDRRQALVLVLDDATDDLAHELGTIAAGQIAGMSRASALEFSFFLSMPTMAVATLYELLKSLRAKGEDALAVGHMTGHQWVVLGIGFVVSFIVLNCINQTSIPQKVCFLENGIK